VSRKRTESNANSNGGGEAVHPPRRRRDGRGWGPFTGGQLSAIIITLAVVAAFPAAANAVSGSSVFVTNPVTGTVAAVDATGKLQVAEATPKNFFVDSRNVFASGAMVVVAPSAGHALVVTSLAIDTYMDTTPGGLDFLELYISHANATCGLHAVDIDVLNPATIGQTVVPFQPGLVVPAGRALCVLDGDATHLQADVFAYGYLIPAAAAPAGA
jgi:hypothetical protein